MKLACDEDMQCEHLPTKGTAKHVGTHSGRRRFGGTGRYWHGLGRRAHAGGSLHVKTAVKRLRVAENGEPRPNDEDRFGLSGKIVFHYVLVLCPVQKTT
jgi:hypothetical protein